MYPPPISQSQHNWKAMLSIIDLPLFPAALFSKLHLKIITSSKNKNHQCFQFSCMSCWGVNFLFCLSNSRRASSYLPKKTDYQEIKPRFLNAEPKSLSPFQPHPHFPAASHAHSNPTNTSQSSNLPALLMALLLPDMLWSFWSTHSPDISPTLSVKPSQSCSSKN